MSLNDIISLIQKDGNTWLTWLVIGSLFIEVTPIKVNPWSAIFDWVGRRINRSIREELRRTTDKSEENYRNMMERIDSIQEKTEKLEKKEEYREAMTCRYRIIRAADEIRNGSDISDEHLEQLGEDIETYDAYCGKHSDYKNHKGQKSKALVLSYEDSRLQPKEV